MYYSNIVMSILTGWSLGYAGVYFRSKEYQRYYPLVITLTLVLVAYKLESPLEYVVCGFIACILTVIFTYDPVIGEGYKVLEEKTLYIKKNSRSRENSDIIKK